MPRKRIEKGGYVYPLQDEVGGPEDAAGWAEEDAEIEAEFQSPSYAPTELDLDVERRPVEEESVGDERDEAWSGRTGGERRR